MLKILAVACAAALAAAPAAATILNEPVPTDNFITFGGLDWAWASPCQPTGCGGPSGAMDMSYQSTQGWRIASTADFANAPDRTAFLRPDNSVICASAWFTHIYSHCDYSNPVWNMDGEGGPWYSETWVVRGDATPGVPEPATWAMLIAGFGLVGTAMRRRTTVVSA